MFLGQASSSNFSLCLNFVYAFIAGAIQEKPKILDLRDLLAKKKENLSSFYGI